jgi:hypothetical protein
MSFAAQFTEEPTEALDACEAYLVSRPIEHNLQLTVLRRRVVDPVPGGYWWVADGSTVVGFAFQSPLGFQSAITQWIRW